MGNDKEVGIVCFCIGQRDAVGTIFLLGLLYTFFCIATLFAGDVREQSGGYNPHTSKLQVWVGAVGSIFYLVGFLGVYDTKIDWIRVGRNYQFVRIFFMLLVFAFDWFALALCENWVSQTYSKTEYNPTLEAVSKKGICPITRLAYFIGFGIDFGFNLYCTWIVQDYYNKIHCNPGYHITYDGVESSGALAFNKKLGEPGEYLGKQLARPSETHGRGYGILPGV